MGGKMEPKDKKEFAEIMQGVIEKSVKPDLKKINEKLDTTMEMVAKNAEDIEVIKEDFKDMGYTVERIETRLDAAFRREDNLELKTSQLQRRVLRLESKKT